MKKIIFINLFIFFFFFFFSDKTLAQGKTWCVWDSSINKCVSQNSCESGYTPHPRECGNLREDLCGGIFDCVTPGTVSCTWSAGSIQVPIGRCQRSISCGAGFEPSPKEDPCSAFDISEGDCLSKSAGTCVPVPTPPSGAVDSYGLCQENSDCIACISDDKSWTAFGCLPTNNPQEFIAWLLQAAIGMAGGIAVLLMIFGGFLVILSSGDPQRLQTGKDILTSAIIGLVIIIFSVFLLRIIGVEILKIPGFE